MSETASGLDTLDTRPGALRVPADSPPPKIRFMDYDETHLVEGEIDDPEELRPYSGTAGTTWIDVQGLGDAERLQAIAGILEIHDLALADAVNAPQRAKAQQYSDHIVVIIRAPLNPFDPASGIPQVCLVLAAGYVVTFQERSFGFFDDVRQRIRDSKSGIRSEGPAFLAHALIDVLIDAYYPIVEDIADQLDDLEARILSRASPEFVGRLHGLQRQITVLRRVARPQVEALHRLAIADSEFIPERSKIFLADAQDHAQQILGRLDSAREIATDMMGAVLATLGHKQNEIMKVLTLVGSVFIPLTFIAGIYGMNFEHMPELKARAGYPIALGAMGFVGVCMVAYFRFRGWIGGSSGNDDS